jgi:hypothetical protein
MTWREIDATQRNDGNFELPCAASSRAADSVPSHKRADIRRRAALLSSVEAQIATTLSLSRYASSRFDAQPVCSEAPALDLADSTRPATVDTETHSEGFGQGERGPSAWPQENIQAA